MLGRTVARSRSRIGTCLLLACITARASAEPAPSEIAATDAEVFAQVFKQHRGDERAPVLLVVDGVADTTVLLADPGGSPAAPAAPILAAVTSKLRTEAVRRLQAAVRDQRLTIDAMRDAGLDVRYDARKLELQIAIPPDLTLRSTHGKGGDRTPAEAAGALTRSDVSGYVNLRGGATSTWTSTDRPVSRAPIHVNVDAVVNLGGWVLEGRADVSEGSAQAPIAVRRGDLLLSHDVPAQALRYLAGDFAVPAAGVQQTVPVLGLGLVRNFALRPYHLVQPVGSFDFVLDRASTVTVLINGSPVLKLDLPAGRHDLRDLPLAAGVNDVELVIRDAAGVERRLSFATASPNQLLAPGVVQFSMAVGFPLVSDVGLRAYDFSRPFASGRRRWGVSKAATFGVSLDASLDRQRAGSEVALATTLGNLALDAAASCDVAEGCGHAEILRYDYTRAARGTVSSFAVVGRHFSPAFRELGLATLANHYSDDIALSTNLGLPRRTVGQLSLRYQLGRDVPDARELSLAVNRSFGRLAVSALASTRRDGVTNESRVLVTAHWVFSGRRGSMHAASRTSTSGGRNNELTYVTGGGPPPGGLMSSLTLQESPTEYRAAGNLDYTGDRFTSALAVGTQVDREHGGVVQSATVEAATALAFAGGRAAWSRPISGSFAMIERNRALDGVRIEVNPALGGYAAATDGFGLAVVPNLEAYRVNRITIDAPTLPVGASLGPASHVVLPSYKSGTLVRVGEEGTVFLRGTLTARDREPLAYAVGELISLDHRGRPPIALMTNRVGRFSAMGVTPGRYAIRISEVLGGSSELEVPAGVSGLYSAGTIAMDVAGTPPAASPVLPPIAMHVVAPVAAPATAPIAVASKPLALVVFAAESFAFPRTARALTAALAAGRVEGSGPPRRSKIALDLVQLSIECNDPSVTCYQAVGRSLAADRLLFAHITEAPDHRVKVTVTLLNVDGSAHHVKDQLYGSDDEAAAAVAELVGLVTRP